MLRKIPFPTRIEEFSLPFFFGLQNALDFNSHFCNIIVNDI